MFAAQLNRVRELTERQVSRYGVDADQLTGIKARLIEWSTRLQRPDAGESFT
ncbi:hypothetical protein OSC27_13370 [Microbacterium sp. STN6]|uniref:hypothetical protein n=1 Tax=Microbacterium sp. STN6 TaxID=2995588 RepID=UPI00226083CF|nr:hypothetical protein [Microbacterium sp. STN6]MCX7523262.1 hypothetical protein [Microbacterium sp. STN6]